MADGDDKKLTESKSAESGKSPAKEKKSAWENLPKILGQIAALIIALGAIFGALDKVGVFDPDPTATPTVTASSTPTETSTITPTTRPTTVTPTLTDTMTATPIPSDTLTPTITRTPTRTLTPTLYPGEPILVVLAWPGINIRRGPGFDYPYGEPAGIVPYGSTVRLLGRTENWNWYRIECPIEMPIETGCWVTADPNYSNAFFVENVPELLPPATFTPMPSPTQTPPG
ncbi:MAG: hypothetical protein FJ010_00015 [Chloroflexi bacterium]|nr:hypothetical protein [Chloroflexota bacterium]